MKLVISDIKIKPDRIRKDFDPKALDELAESIRTVGLIEPVVVDDDLYLLAGERRVRACRLLGWSEITAVYMHDLDDWTKNVVELEENIRREDLSYVEEVMAMKRLHDLYQDKHGKSSEGGGRGRNEGWKVRDTADLLGISVGAVSQDIQLAKAIEHDPELAQQKSKIAAKSLLGRKQALKARSLLALLQHKQTDTQTDTQPTTQPDISLLHGNCLDIIPTLPDSSIACLITDPPWQVEFDKQFGSDPKAGLNLAEQMLKALYPKLQDEALCWMFCATNHVMKGVVYDLVLSCGYFVFDSLFIWYKPTVAHSSNPYRELKKDFETALLFSKGRGRDLAKPMFSVYMTKLQGRKLHPAQKPVDMLKAIIEVSTVPTELIIDPFMGSGSTMVACKQTNRRGIGVDKEKQWFDLAKAEVELA
ncbi:MAG: ParB/RepB/Spo0J family partition protein [Gammaproteobacteria bacterium]|nr:ParB/RepB/Spo0J family partition protein [Gammaproteobacteria bacterium]